MMVVGGLSVSVAAAAAAAAGAGKRCISVSSVLSNLESSSQPAFLKAIPGRYQSRRVSVGYQILTRPRRFFGLPGSGAKQWCEVSTSHLDSRKEAYVPLQLQAQWRCEAHQTSFLLTYSSNPLCNFSTSASGGPAVLQDLQFAVSLAPSEVSKSCRSPQRLCCRDESLFWKINENFPFPAGEEVVGKRTSYWQDAKSKVPHCAFPVHLKWKIVGQTISNLGITTVSGDAASDGGLKIDEVVRGVLLASLSLRLRNHGGGKRGWWWIGLRSFVWFTEFLSLPFVSCVMEYQRLLVPMLCADLET